MLGGYEDATHTVIRFKRAWDTCDPNGEQDYVLSSDTVTMIWAYHEEDPTDETNPPMHEQANRGTQPVVLTAAETLFEPTPDMHYFDMVSENYVIPHDDDTTYWCQVFKVPDELVDRKHHVVAVSCFFSCLNNPIIIILNSV